MTSLATNTGVVELPTMKVRDIRDKYKVRDYEDYAKPKSLATKKSKSGNEMRSPKSSQSDVDPDDVIPSDHEVAQQVMSLFKGALDVQNDLEALEQDSLANNREESTGGDPQSPTKQPDQVPPPLDGALREKLSTDSSASPEHESNQESSQPLPELSKGDVDVKEDKLAPNNLTTEPEAPASFDDTLDQFYDVLNNLST